MSGDEAVAYIKAKLSNWLNIPAHLKALITRAGTAQARARAAGNQAAVDKLTGIMVNLANLHKLVTDVNGKVDTVVRQLRAAGLLAGAGELGAVPLVIGAAAIVAAAGMALVYKSIAHQEDLLRGVERGLLPPSVLTPPAGNGGGGIFGNLGAELGKALGPIVLVSLAGIALYFVAQQPPARERAA